MEFPSLCSFLFKENILTVTNILKQNIKMAMVILNSISKGALSTGKTSASPRPHRGAAEAFAALFNDLDGGSMVETCADDC